MQCLGIPSFCVWLFVSGTELHYFSGNNVISCITMYLINPHTSCETAWWLWYNQQPCSTMGGGHLTSKQFGVSGLRDEFSPNRSGKFLPKMTQRGWLNMNFSQMIAKARNKKYFHKHYPKSGLTLNVIPSMSIFDIRIPNQRVGLRRKKGLLRALHPYPPWENPRLNIKMVLPDMGISIIKIRRPGNRLIFKMGIQYW